MFFVLSLVGALGMPERENGKSKQGAVIGFQDSPLSFYKLFFLLSYYTAFPLIQLAVEQLFRQSEGTLSKGALLHIIGSYTHGET